MVIAVIDIETTGLDPKNSKIVEVGIVRLDLETGEQTVLMDYVCHEKGITAEELAESWIIQHTDLTVDQIRYSVPFDSLKPRIQAILNSLPATAYNQKFDFGFFEARGIKILHKLPDPMQILTPIMEIPHEYYGIKYPSVEEAYEFMFDEPLKEKHRAGDDAQREAEIIYALYQRGWFSVPNFQKIAK